MKSIALPSRYFVAIFVVAFATLATQVLLSRILSVTLYYQFAFAGITFAMLGLTAGALRVYNEPEKYSAEKADSALAEYCSRFATSLVLAVLIHILMPAIVAHYVPADFSGNGPLTVGSLGVSLGLLLFAFIESGVCIGLLLTRFPDHTNRLYACDLIGAASGCVVIVGALMIFDPMGTLLIIAVLVSLTAWRLLPENATRRLALRVRITAGVLAAMCVVQVASYQLGAPVVRLRWAKGTLIDQKPLFERWNTYSRVAVSEYPGTGPFGWGFGTEHHENVPQKYLTIDADASTTLTAFDGDLSKVAYLQDDIINLGYHVRDMQSVAVIGVGGGRDILSALIAGATRVRGIELNPAIFESLTRVFGDFTGHLERRPEVTLANAEARSYLNAHDDTYDLVQISLIDTWATTAAGGLTLSENKLYTTDAWNDFLSRLNDHGMLVVSRWYEPNTHPGEFYRMLSIAADVLHGADPNVDLRSHLLAATVNSIVTLVVSKSPLTPAEIEKFESTCRTLHFAPLLTPTFAIDDVAAKIASGKADRAYFDSLPIDITPTSDDRPFFFYTQRISGFFGSETDTATFHVYSDSTTETKSRSTGGGKNSFASAIVLEILVLTFVAGVVFIAGPMFGFYKRHKIQMRNVAPEMIYFGGIGLGFMLIEISQMQRLMVFLGHPVYGLSVVLFVLLLASGVGSYSQRRIAKIFSAPWFSPAILCMVLVIIGFLTPVMTEHLKHYDNGVRIVASALFMAPMGLVMGTMFPTGVAFASIRHEDLLPWYWGINGAASVFASALGVALSLLFGISVTFWLGVGCYVITLVAIAASTRNQGTTA